MTNVMRDKAAPAYRLDGDIYRGFKVSVNNGQVRLALEYAVLIMAEQQEAIEKLRSELDSTKTVVMEAVRTASSEDAGSRRRRAEKTEEKEDTPVA